MDDFWEAVGMFLYSAIYAAGIAVCTAAGAAFGIVVGSFFALLNCVRAARGAFNFRDWVWERDAQVEPARRSYFFGPCYRQIWDAVAASFRSSGPSRDRIMEWSEDLRLSVESRAALMFFYGLEYGGVFAVYAANLALCALLAALMGGACALIAAGYSITFMVVRGLDTLYLAQRGIRSDCPLHKETYRVPAFECPNPACRRIHRNLRPNIFGIWHHRCLCGTALPATFLNGRSQMTAYCPECGAELAASNARPVVLQLVGGSHAGKSVYMASCWHLLFERLGRAEEATALVPPNYRPYFDQLERWFTGQEPCLKTTDVNSQMYPVLVDSRLEVRRQVTLYDVAGELFSNELSPAEIQQRQFSYCNGFLLLLDPFSSGDLRKSKEVDGLLPLDYSSARAEDVVIGFKNYLVGLGYVVNGRKYDIPVAVLLAKADEPEVAQALGPGRLQQLLAAAPEEYRDIQEVRDAECRRFLMEHDMGQVVSGLEDNFSSLHYYPVSAMGHKSSPGAGYAPWGVMEPVEDLLRQADPELYNLLQAAPAYS